MKRFFFLVFALILLGAFSVADEGMWLYNAFPKDQVKAKYKFQPTQAFLDHLRLSSVRLGASGSFVSPDGLIFTNHHVGAGCIHDVSTADKDYMKNGFYAKTRAEEPKCPGLEVSVLQDIEDVTAKVNQNVKSGMNPAEVLQAQRAVMSTLEKDCSVTNLRCETVTLYSGALYHLYKYHRFADVRLVFAPEYDVAFFGGDPDNFTYPRYDLDITFLRAYENGRPARTEHFLKWSKEGVKEGDLIFVSGHPGSTARLYTLAQMEFLRDFQYPRVLKQMERRISVLQKFAAESPENARIVERQFFGLQNSYKATVGYHSGLLDKQTMARKAAEEKALRDSLAADPKKKFEFGDPWTEIDKAVAAQKQLYIRNSYLDGTFGGSLTAIARNLVRAADERQKPNAERLREFRESALPALERRLFTPLPVYKRLEVVQLTDGLADLKDSLGPNDAFVQRVLGDKSPAEVAKALVEGTKLNDIAFRKQLYEGGAAAVAASNDPMIVLMRNIDPDSRAMRKRVENEVTSVEQRNATLIAKLLFAEKGLNTPADATGTLRLSYGVVKGYTEGGHNIPYFTTFAGAYQHAAKHDNKSPYALPQTWMAAPELNQGRVVNAAQKSGALNLNTPLNFVSTADIIGGNSGSPVVNTKGEIVGIIFDGNIQAQPWRFMYEDVVGRAVSVDSRGILEGLRNIYKADDLVNELLGPVSQKKRADKATPAGKQGE